MEPVRHAGPLRDPAEAAMEPLIHQSPCSWQETDPGGTVPAGHLEPRWLTGPGGGGTEAGDRYGSFTHKRKKNCSRCL